MLGTQQCTWKNVQLTRYPKDAKTNVFQKDTLLNECLYQSTRVVKMSTEYELWRMQGERTHWVIRLNDKPPLYRVATLQPLEFSFPRGTIAC